MNRSAVVVWSTPDERMTPGVQPTIPRVRGLSEDGNIAGPATSGDDEPTWPFWTWFIENPRRNRGVM